MEHGLTDENPAIYPRLRGRPLNSPCPSRRINSRVRTDHLDQFQQLA